MELMGVKEQMMGGVEAMLPIIDQMAANWQLDEEARQELINIYRQWFAEDFDQDLLVADMVELYRETFTDEELQALIDFYSTPVGQKILSVTPELAKRGAAMGMAEAQRKEPQLMERLEPFLEKHLN